MKRHPTSDDARMAAGKVGKANEQRLDHNPPASTGRRACTCRGSGQCLCCRYWHIVLDSFAQRGIVAVPEVTV